MSFEIPQVIYTDANGVPCASEDAVWSVRGNLRTSKTRRPQVRDANGVWAEAKS
jgi:hypothetical protein